MVWSTKHLEVGRIGRVVVVGGGYGGIAAASLLDPIADVVLVEPREEFVHNVAALRGLVDQAWAPRLFLPYDRLLNRGKVIRDHVAAVMEGAAEDDGGPVTVRLRHGAELRAEFVVLATGSRYPFPAKFDELDSVDALGRLDRVRSELDAATEVLLLGAGPVGVELAGEITSAWPDKHVTILDPHPNLLGGAYTTELRGELHRQLTARGVELRLGESLVREPVSPPARRETFSVPTSLGRTVGGDMWFRCHGAVPVSDYLSGALGAARTDRGHVRVGSGLQVPRHPRVFAIGDLAAVAEPKTAKAAGQHAEIVAERIRAVLDGRDETAVYSPGPPAIVVPLGPDAGASYSPQTGLLGAEATTSLKSSHMKIGEYRDMLGVGEL